MSNQEGASLSKNELKRQQKLAKKEQEKKEKDAAKAVAAASNENAKKEKKEVVADPSDPQEYFNMRVRMIEARRAAGENPFPHKFHVSISLANYIKKYENTMENNEVRETEPVSVAGKFLVKIHN
uniref:Uncharacterized protein n=1 Tax=Panagrolaimus superbus TaxID=310955 RepID=A0A914YCS7_9BILA